MFAKKSLGQNFLNSQGALTKIVSAGEVVSTDTVLEVGPGRGALTSTLLATGARVIAVEKDDQLIPFLQEKYAAEIARGQFTLVHADILDLNPETLASSTTITGVGQNLRTGEYKLIANIPYYITGQFFKKFLSEVAQPKTMVILVQKEVADRVMARDNKESILSISIKAYGEPKYIATVLRGSFTPAPNVDSAILAIYNISKKNFAMGDDTNTGVSEQKFFEIMKAGFAHKRKKLFGNLREKLSLDESQLTPAFANSTINLDTRAEDLTVKDWIALTKNLGL